MELGGNFGESFGDSVPAEPNTPDGMYLVDYSGKYGSGHGACYIYSGILKGRDFRDMRYEGKVILLGNKKFDFDVNILGNGSPLVTGITPPNNLLMQIGAEVPEEFFTEAQVFVFSILGGDVSVQMRRV